MIHEKETIFLTLCFLANFKMLDKDYNDKELEIMSEDIARCLNYVE